MSLNLRGNLVVYGRPEAIGLVKFLLMEHIKSCCKALEVSESNIKDFENKLFNPQ